MAEKKRKKPIVILTILILLILAGVLFYYLALPELAVRYMKSDRAPEFVKELNRQIEANSEGIRRSLSGYGVSSEEAAEIIRSIDYDDIEYIQVELAKEGYNDREKCADIILSRVESKDVDKEKLRAAIVENISMDDLQAGMEQFSQLNPAAVKAALPVLKEMAGQTLISE